jgi:tetratricopeptide (TPR) repeat protein
LLAGNRDACVELLEKEGPAAGGLEAPFALGLFYAEQGRLQEAEERLLIALGPAKARGLSGRVLKELGRVAAARGDAARARSLFSSAQEADPSDQEAAFLATNPGRAAGKP